MKESRIMKTYLVKHFTGVWRLSQAQYAKLLKLILNNKEWDLNELGVRLDCVKMVNVTDMDTNEAEEELAELGEVEEAKVEAPLTIGCCIALERPSLSGDEVRYDLKGKGKSRGGLGGSDWARNENLAAKILKIPLYPNLGAAKAYLNSLGVRTANFRAINIFHVEEGKITQQFIFKGNLIKANGLPETE